MRDLLKFFMKLGITVGIIFVLFTFVFGIHRVSGNSMFPDFKDGDLIITYRFDELHTEDCVMYIGSDGEKHVGRIVANSGDEISIDNGQIVLNGSVVSSEIMYDTTEASGGVTYPYTVSDNAVFVMNDYRIDTDDSRLFGEVKKSDLRGKVIFILRRRSF